MPRLIYKPEGVESRNLDFDFGKLMSPERIVIERAAMRCLERPVGWIECKRLLFADFTPIVTAFLYVLLKRDDPTLKFSEFAICDDDYELDLSDEEARTTLVELEQMKEPDDDPESPEWLEIVRARDELRSRFAEDDLDAGEGAEVTELPKAKKRA